MTQPTATGKVIIFSAPSGAGKSTIIGRLLRDFPQLEFSISATSRAPRGRRYTAVSIISSTMTIFFEKGR